ncbi:MAG: hypothetical protein ACXW0T_08865 [Methylobacter sp.]
MRKRNHELDAKANRLRLVPVPLKTIPAQQHIQIGKPGTDIAIVEFERYQRAADYAINPRTRFKK